MNLAEAVTKLIEVRPEQAVGWGGQIDEDDYQFRSLSQSPKDLEEYKFERSLKIAYYDYLTHPLARRIVEIQKDFVIGHGITFDSKNEKTLNLLKHFWFDSYNDMETKQHQKLIELSIYGEQIYPVAVNEANGHVRLGYIDPLSVQKIMTSPDNIEDVLKIKLKGTGGKDGKVYDIIKRRDEKLDGDCFLFRINNVSNQLRGVSDLLPLLDWLDVFDQTLMNEADRIQLMKSFIWDVLLDGKNDAEIKKWLRDQKAPKPGSVRAHNESVTWSAVAPDLKVHESIEFIRFLLEFMLGGVGIPGHYFGFGQQTNKSTAETMDLPFLKRLEVRQTFVKSMFKQIFDFVIEKAIEKNRIITEYKTGKKLGAITESDDCSYSVILPEPSTKDIKDLAGSLVNLAQGLTLATQNDWLSSDGAAKVYQLVLNEFGSDIDYEADQKQIEQEEKDNTEDYEKVAMPDAD